MIVTKTMEDGVVTLSLDGKLGVSTSAQFHEVVEDALEESNEVILNLKNLSYISSAGLWVLFLSDKSAKSKGKTLKLINISKDIMYIFCKSGFHKTLTLG